MDTLRPDSTLRRIVLLGVGAALIAGCAGVFQPPAYEFFVAPAPRDPWSSKIAGWQSRERRGPGLESLRAAPSVSGSGTRPPPAADRSEVGDLREKYFEYRNERKRALARDLASWVQREAKKHYVPDGVSDHWATLEETLARNGDDCDGLELLAYYFLRDLGFGDDEVFRAIVVRPSDGQHHMVTLWFESPTDPWVIDPTGAMTSGMPHMSDLPGWVPLKLFSENEEFSVERVTERLARNP
jgi:hypothetical protein